MDRLDVFAQKQTGLSRNTVQKLIAAGSVLVNGREAKASYKVCPEDVVEIDIPAAAEMSVEPEDIPLVVFYEDNDLIVVDKPKGMVVHPAPGHYGGTLVNALLYHCHGSLSGIGGIARPGIVHRIDKDTSGLLVAAKNDAAHCNLSAQFAAHSIKRQYAAIVHGGFKHDTGTIDAPIARHPVDRKKMAIHPRGRRAVTHYRVEKPLGRHTFVKCTLETGRTHQIRVHMASIGHPILGDAVYGSAKNKDGQTLHAEILGFAHPNGRYMEFESPLPQYFCKILGQKSEFRGQRLENLLPS